MPTVPVGVQVSDRWFQHVALTNAAGKTVAGALNRQRTAFSVAEPLGYDAVYTWSGSVVGRDGRPRRSAPPSTVTPSKVVGGWFQLTDGQTVGIAAPIILQFDAPSPTRRPSNGH